MSRPPGVVAPLQRKREGAPLGSVASAFTLVNDQVKPARSLKVIGISRTERMDSSGLGAGPQDAEGLPSWLEPLVISCQGLFPPDLFSSLKGCFSIAWFKRLDQNKLSSSC